LVQFATKETKAFFVERVEENEGWTFGVKFMRRRGKAWKFSFPEKHDVREIQRDDILKPPQPSVF
jgi:hypothetical protein